MKFKKEYAKSTAAAAFLDQMPDFGINDSVKNFNVIPTIGFNMCLYVFNFN